MYLWSIGCCCLNVHFAHFVSKWGIKWNHTNNVLMVRSCYHFVAIVILHQIDDCSNHLHATDPWSFSLIMTCALRYLLLQVLNWVAPKQGFVWACCIRSVGLMISVPVAYRIRSRWSLEMANTGIILPFTWHGNTSNITCLLRRNPPVMMNFHTKG